MKNIKRIIHIKIMEICMVIVFVVCSYFIWNSLNKSELFKLLESTSIPSSYAYVEVLNENHYNMYPMGDEEGASLIPNTVQIVNDTYIDTKYALGIRVLKTSTINYQDLKISFQNNVNNLKEFYQTEDETYYYFLLEKGNVQAQKIFYEIKLWVNQESENDVLEKTFEYEFINLEGMMV